MTRGTFRVRDARDRLESRIPELCTPLPSTLPSTETLIDAMVGWYLEERARRVDVGRDGDMLLVQWQWARRGMHAGRFEFELVRQLSPRRSDTLVQLALTLRFTPEQVPAETPGANLWIPRPTDDAGPRLRAAPGFAAVRGLSPVDVEVRLDTV